MTNVSIIETLLSSINSFSTEFQNDLFGYLYESDIQCALFSKLRSDINEQIKVVGINETYYNLNLIYSEYLNAFDLCCLNPEKIINLTKDDVISEYHGHDDYLYYHLPVLVAMELKFLKGKRKGNFHSFLNDEEKINKSFTAFQKGHISHWLNICFIQYDEVMDFHQDVLKGTHTIISVDKVNIDCSYAITPTRILSVKKI